MWTRDGETDYSDGYFCGEHVPIEQEAEDTFIPAGAELLEYEVSELGGAA